MENIPSPTIKRKITIDMKNTTSVICEGCKGQAFQPAVMLQKASALVTSSGKTEYIQIPCVVCAECGQINRELLPEELKSGFSLPSV